ncbi:MAG: SPFH domain-containing protein, partial [Bacteroidota bacterium]
KQTKKGGVMLILYSVLGTLGLVLFIILLASSIVVVRGNEIAVLERKYFGVNMPQGRVIAMKNEIGIQARTLGPGMHFLTPFIYKAKKFPFTIIGEQEVGMVESIDGNSIPAGNIFARVVENHDSFQDGVAFLENGGEKGPQIQILAPGTYRINTVLFKVKTMPALVVDKGEVCLVTAMDGEPIPNGRLLSHNILGHSTFENGDQFLKNHGQKGPQAQILLPGTYRINTDLFKLEKYPATIVPSGKVGLVTARDGEPLPETEYVAKSTENHNNYQNIQAFLEGMGQRGPQLDVLKPGTYYINPLMFQVELDDVAVVERGQVAVVVSNIGEEPRQIKELLNKVAVEESKKEEPKPEVTTEESASAEKRFEVGIERYVVPKGFRGIQQEVAGPGIYYLNRRAYIAYIIDTTNITIDWDDAKETNFDPLKVISRDGFEISVSVKVIIRVRPDQAPYMVAKIGSIDNLIQHVIHPMIDSSFRNQASSTSAMNFMQDRQEEQHKAEERARTELEKYHVECVSVLICQIKLPQELMDTQTMKIIAQQQQAMYEEQQKAEQTRIATEKTRSEAEQQKNLVEAEIGVKIAEQNKLKQIKLAEGQSETFRLQAEGEAKGIKAKGEAEGAKILAIGEATAKAYELQNKAVGQQGVTAIEIAKQIANGNIKVTPDFLVQGNENIGGLLSAFLTKQMIVKDEIKPEKTDKQE